MKNPLIIDARHSQSFTQRSLGRMLTSFFWVVWGYLWLPLLTLMAWAFGVSTAYDHFVIKAGYLEFLRLLPFYLITIGLSSGALLLWSAIQYRRFHGKERRRSAQRVTSEQVAKSLGLDASALKKWTGERLLVAHHDQNGALRHVEVLSESAPSLLNLDTNPIATPCS